MRKSQLQGGFTLLEILVVIIIVGVLASVAMPALFRNVERARATEALNTMGVIRRAYLGCRLQEDPNAGITNCSGSFDALGMDDPGAAPNSHFTYITNNGSGVYILRATRNAVDGGDNASVIQWEWDVSSGATTWKFGTGVFQGIQF